MSDSMLPPTFTWEEGEWDARVVQLLKEASDKPFVLHSWEDVKLIIAENRIGDLRRLPGDLVKYLRWKKTLPPLGYTDIEKYIVAERLKWDNPPVPKSDKVFEYPEDWKILPNDFPYGVEPGIVHLVVWTKQRIDEASGRGDDLSPEGRAAVNEFCAETFPDMPAERLMWFKNWGPLRSVAGVEHFHVLLRDPPPGLVHRLTGEEAKDPGYTMN
ncbi:hypothetical protein SAICODRAFT_222705 [Saitoella complicata NRRL Y-17804]|uniref:uncharacterized protein n=1 Tax=Saitoella complicata (strain BCRC 22490 / CBS 7301 / JCM 7358 / NBRC 10748 / NRRL Y-17804) TaxID=698492 RepID=UPI0008678E03|nr:uncharacterized protein SAICODRAFT_222705 [Saitoella complicata NRRL Y-17804]ODQ53643.1 hypothetical protein SAICODRAFT_222705 [Saitoella complicata NRRL Y-17804]